MKVLVTGALGFIGSHTVATLLNNGYEVLGFDNLINPSLCPTDRIKQATGENWPKFRFFKQDIKNLDGMMSICAVEKPDLIVHLAALGSISRSFENPAETIHVNEVGFANVWTLASYLGIKRVVFASSSNVYGSSKSILRIEGEEGFPMNPYGLSKINNETLAKIMGPKTGVQYCGLRFFNVYGPGQSPDGPYAAVIPRFINDPELVIYGDGTNSRDFTFVKDVAEIILSALVSPNANFIVNVGAGHKTSIIELASMLADGRPIVKKNARPGEIQHSQASVENLKRILKPKPFTSLCDGLEQTKRFYKCQTQIQNEDDHLKKV